MGTIQEEIREAVKAVLAAEIQYHNAAALYEETAWLQLSAAKARLNALITESKDTKIKGQLDYRPHTYRGEVRH